MNHHQKEGGESLSKVPDLIGNISLFKAEFPLNTGYHDVLGRPVIKAIKAIQASFDQKVRQQIKQQLLHCLHYQILPKKLKIFAQKMVDGNEIVKNENLVYLESQTANHLCIRSKRESVNITSNQLIRSNNYQYQLSFFFIQT